MHGAELTDTRGQHERKSCRQEFFPGKHGDLQQAYWQSVSELWAFLGVVQPLGKGGVDCFTCPVPARDTPALSSEALTLINELREITHKPDLEQLRVNVRYTSWLGRHGEHDPPQLARKG